MDQLFVDAVNSTQLKNEILVVKVMQHVTIWIGPNNGTMKNNLKIRINIEAT